MRGIVITGARILVYLNGKKFGRALSFGFTSSTPYREIETIDKTLPAELAPTRQRVSAQLGIIRTEADGGAEGMGLIPPGADLPRGQYFTIELRDRVTSLTLFRSDACCVDSQSWQVVAKGRWEGQLSIKCIGCSDEVG